MAIDSRALVDRLGRLDSCVLSDALDAAGLPGAVTGILPMTTRDTTIAGRVLTIEVVRRTNGVSAPHLASAALAIAEPGDVLVVASGGITDVSSWGGILSHGALQQGVQGVVVDGAFRDIDEIRQLGLPVHARGAVPITARGRLVERSHGGPVTLAGVEVDTDDLVIADGSGVVFLPRAHAASLLDAAEGLAARETAMVRAIQAGTSIAEVMHDESFRRGGG